MAVLHTYAVKTLI